MIRVSNATALFSILVAVAASLTMHLAEVPMPALAWTLLLLLLLGSLAIIDLTTETVPDALTYALVVSGMMHGFAVGWPLMPSLVGALSLLALGYLHGWATGDKGWIGSGDFFLLAGLTAWFGPLLLVDVLALASVFLVLHSLVVRRASVALAPSLALSASVIWLGGSFI